MGKSVFARQKFVEAGLIQNACSSASLSASDGCVWIGSSFCSCSKVLGRLSVVVFERGSRLEGISDSVFCDTGLQSITIPSSVVVLGKESFCECESREWVVFENDSRLERIEEAAFSGTGLNSIVIPSAVIVLGESSFSCCDSLESVAFESGSQLERIEEYAFQGSGLHSIVVPSSVVVLGKSSFFGCRSLQSVIFLIG
jgi:hypothetical protein